MAQNKITQRDFITMALELMNKTDGIGQDMLDKGADMLKALDRKKGSSSGSLTKVQKENEVLRGVILGILEDAGRPMSIKDIKACSEDLSKFDGSQKVSALLKPLVDGGVVDKVSDKDGVKFVFVATDEDEVDE